MDAAGKVWVTNLNDNWIHRIDPATNAIDLSKELLNSGGHYTYSDMTGIVSRTITTKIGTWTVVYDSNVASTPWETVTWNANTPAGTSLTVKVRSSEDQVNWSGWETAVNGGTLGATIRGRYVAVQVTLQSPSGGNSPVLYDITITRTGGSVPEAEYSISLDPGWNFVSVPRTLENGNNTALIFRSVSTEGHSIWLYDASGRRWTAMTSSTKVKPLDGIWIYSASEVQVPLSFSQNPIQTPPTKLLYQGWNAIGFTDVIPASARATLLSVKNDWTHLMGYDSEIQQYEASIINGESGPRSDAKEMIPFRGYWLYMTGDIELAAISS